MIAAWRCPVCATTVDIAVPSTFRCPNATATDRHHVLHPLDVGPMAARLDDPNPFVAYGPRLAWWAFARANGMTEAACVALTRELGDGFVATPFAPSVALGEAFGAEVWVKDETGNVGGSHKARHLVTALLHLRASEALGLVGGIRPPLAIASCGNAAIAAATLAGRASWPIEVFVPDWASETVIAALGELGASVTICPRRAGEPPGDPAVLRYREAVDAGALPFTVQGPENAWCLDGGRTIGWEMADGATPSGVDRVVVQVGGGAFAACTGWGMGSDVRLDTVQAEGCAPLARAWSRAQERGLTESEVGRHWSEIMTTWDDPHSVADGILDDETYDWLAVFDAMRTSGGRPLVAGEAAIRTAHGLAARTGIDASPTGTAGLAGLLTDGGRPHPGERVAVVLSGVER